jgi:hypothetical protein
MTEKTAGNWDLRQDTEEVVLKSLYKLSHFSTFQFGVLISRIKCFLYSEVEVVHYAKGVKIWLFYYLLHV